jgi:hypothetical protein
MLTASNLSNANRFLTARVLCGVSLALCIVSLAAVSGCDGSKKAKNSVTGKVSLDGEPVAGSITFVSATNKEEVTPIKPDGTYLIENLPPGTYKVLVKSMLGGKLVAPPKDKGGAEMPSMPGSSKGVDPPEKYASATSSDLTFEVKTGKQTYDIPLSK